MTSSHQTAGFANHPQSTSGTIPLGTTPTSIATDTANGNLYVVNQWSNSVSVVSSYTRAVIATVGAGDQPLGARYDPSNNEVYVLNEGNNDDNLTVIACSNNTDVASLWFGDIPLGMSYDPLNSQLYVETVNHVIVYSSANHRVASLPYYYPYGIGLDTRTGDLYVAVDNVGSGYVSVISGTTNQVITNISVGGDLGPVAMDPAHSRAYFADTSSHVVFVVDTSTNSLVDTVSVGSAPSGLSLDTSTGLLYVAHAGARLLSIVRTSDEKLERNVTLSTNMSGVATDFPDGVIYIVQPNNNSIDALSTSALKSIASVPTGAHPYGIYVDAINATVYVTTPGSNSMSYFPAYYPLNFSESGLPRGVSWGVMLGGSHHSSNNSSSQLFGVNRGAVNYSIDSVGGFHQPSVPYFGQLNIGTSPPPVILLTFSPVLYSVTFQETGLPVGVGWGVQLGDLLNTTLNTTNPFLVANGTYLYNLTDVSGFHQLTLPYNGTVHVAAAPIVEPPLKFIEVTYAMVFRETGLPNGTSWSVTVTNPDGSQVAVGSSAATQITLEIWNGTFEFKATTSSEYLAFPPNGSLTVNGPADAQAIVFAVLPPSQGHLGPSASSSETLELVVGIAVIAAAILAVALFLRRKPGTRSP